MSTTSLMNTTVAIQTESVTKDALGITTRTWATTTASIPARVRSLHGDQQIVYGRLGLKVTDLFYFATDPGLTGNENISRIAWAGRYFYVRKVNNEGGQMNRVWQVMCEKDKT